MFPESLCTHFIYLCSNFTSICFLKVWLHDGLEVIAEIVSKNCWVKKRKKKGRTIFRIGALLYSPTVLIGRHRLKNAIAPQNNTVPRIYQCFRLMLGPKKSKTYYHLRNGQIVQLVVACLMSQ